MIKKMFFSFMVLGILWPGSPALSSPSLHDYAFNVNGDLYVKSFPTGMDSAGFDPNTGLGTLTLTFKPGVPGNYSIRAFFDHEIQETVNGFDNEQGGSSGSPTSGQSWEVGEPGYKSGAVYTHFLSGSLSNTNGIPPGTPEDVSMAMGWAFSLASNEWVRVTLVLTQDGNQVPANGFYLSHTDPQSNETVYFHGSLVKGFDAAQYTVSTNPAGLQVTVDGVGYMAPQSFNWGPGTTHTISVASPQDNGLGTRYLFGSWSDGGLQSHTVTVPATPYVCTAAFGAQYRLMTSVSPSGGGEVIPSGTNWYDGGQVVTLEARASAEYRFKGWSGDLTGNATSTTVTMNGPRRVVAEFESLVPQVAARIPAVAGWGMVLTILLMGAAGIYWMRRKLKDQRLRIKE